MLTVRAVVQQIPPDNTGQVELAIDEVHATAATYDEAKAEVEYQLPAGWRILHFRVERDP